MKPMHRSAGLFSLALALTLGAGISTARAEEPSASEAPEGERIRAQDIVVQANIGYRNRLDVTEPQLVYDTEYFQRFEPLTAGDALKRVPSVTFLSDVIESDGPRLRGLPPSYTQILINGERVPGSGDDRSFFLDRIPAELISRVELVRSSSARRTGDAIAGTINIVLRDGLELDGGYVRMGGLRFDDKELEPSLGFVYGGQVGPGRLLLGGNLQGRHNPKRKQSLRYGDSPENNPDYAADDFDNREDQTDTRDGKDYSANFSYDIDGETTRLSLNGFFVKTDRKEDERSFEFNDRTTQAGPSNPFDEDVSQQTVDNHNVANIDQQNYSLDGKLTQEWSLGETSLKVGYARFKEKRRESEIEIAFDEKDPEIEGVLTATDILDKELTAKLEHEFRLTDDIKFVVGGFLHNKDRDLTITEAESGGELGTRVWDRFNQVPDSVNPAYDPAEPVDGGIVGIKERRRDLFALVEGKMETLSWEVGVRYETTKVRIFDGTVAAAIANQRNKYNQLLPSASIKFDVTDRDRITASVARTARRPDFNFILPTVLTGELGDNDLRGNPQLDPELAWGGDLGFEHRIGSTGIVGVNVFYRKVKDLIEMVNTLEEGDDGPGSFVFQPRNVGSGKVYGVEFDLSTSLGFIGLPDTGVFGNLSLLNSRVTDALGRRRFNGQSKYVYNFGFIQNLPSFGAAFGATYRKQGTAFDRVVAEEVTTSYGADLEIFIEKRIGDRFTIRAVGSNLLNGAKRESFNKFDNLADQRDRDFDEYELESEKAGPVFQIMARYAF